MSKGEDKICVGEVHSRRATRATEDKIITTKRLQGKVAVVTGGNSGIGLASAKRLQEEGARVAISGRNPQTLAEAQKSIGNGVLVIEADVAKSEDLDRLYATDAEKLGKIDVLFV